MHLHAHGDPDLCNLAGACAAGIFQNHPFVDGNKRTAFVIGALFLDRNALPLTAPEPEVVVMTLGLAAGEVDEGGCAAWLRDRSPPASRAGPALARAGAPICAPDCRAVVA